MGLLEIASGQSVWRGMDYYDDKKVLSWKVTGDESHDGIVSGRNGHSYNVHIDKVHPRKSTCTCPFAASEVGTGKGFAYQEFLDQLGHLSAPSCCFSSVWFKGPAIFFLHTGFGIAWFLGSWLLGVLYDIDVLYLTAVSVGAQLLAIVFYLLCIRKAAQEA